MKINEIQKILTQLSQKYGNIEVYFDCPKCNRSFVPNELVAVGAHMTEKVGKNVNESSL